MPGRCTELVPLFVACATDGNRLLTGLNNSSMV